MDTDILLIALGTAVGPRIAALDEALTLIAAAGLDDVERGTGLDVSVTRPLRQAVSDYLSTLEYVFVDSAADVPDAPTYDQLLEAGIVDDDRMRRGLGELVNELETRRALPHGYVRHDGWTWDAVHVEEVDPERTS